MTSKEYFTLDDSDQFHEYSFDMVGGAKKKEENEPAKEEPVLDAEPDLLPENEDISDSINPKSIPPKKSSSTAENEPSIDLNIEEEEKSVVGPDDDDDDDEEKSVVGPNDDDDDDDDDEKSVVGPDDDDDGDDDDDEKSVVGPNDDDDDNANDNANNDIEFELEGDVTNNAEQENITLVKEEVIPEEKIIANDLDQKVDLINEIMKDVPEKLREKRHILRKINNIVRFFEHLKRNHSEYENDEIKKAKINGENYNPNFESMFNGEFNNSTFIPIVNERKNLYDIINKDLDTGDLLDELDDTNIIKKSNEQDIIDFAALREKYASKKTQNYSYRREINEQNNLTRHYINKPDDFITFQLKEDLEVYNDELMLFNNSKFSNNRVKHKLLGDTYMMDRVLERGEDITVKGLLKYPIQKNNIMEFGKNHLLDIANEKYRLQDLYQNLGIVKTEILDTSLKLGDMVKAKVEGEDILGEVIDFEEDTIKVKTDLNEVVVDKTIKIYNINKSDRNNAIANEPMFVEYLYGSDKELSPNEYRKFLENVLPTNKDVADKLSEISSDNIEDYFNQLSFYNMTLDSLTDNLFKEIRTKLNNNNDKQIRESVKNATQFKTFLLKPSSKKVKNFSFIPNSKLKQYEKLYGEYPYYRTDIDSISTRLNWLKSRKDSGELFFKDIVSDLQKFLKINPEEVVKELKEKVVSALETKSRIENYVDTERKKLAKSKSVCLTNYISKEYFSIDDLKNDNNREIKVDKDKLRIGESDIVPIDSFALLKEHGGKRTLFKRVQLAEGKQLWVLEDKINIDEIVDSNKDFCDQQFKTLDEIDSAIKECKFSTVENSCLPKSLEKAVYDLHLVKEEVNDLNEKLKETNEILNFSSNLEQEIDYYKQYLELVNDQKRRIFLNKEDELVEEKEVEVDPMYEVLYQKIDIYLEKISQLNDKLRLELLDDLIKKYGRDANVRDKENPKNIYCKYGNKVICCKHHQNMIKINNSKHGYEEILEETIREYGIEEDGRHWCNNCGAELFLAEFETLEGFKKNGARDITHEVLEVDEEDVDVEVDKENLELMKKLIKSDETGDDFSTINEIVTVLTNIMGIKLNINDQMKILDESDMLQKKHVKSKDEYKLTYKGKPKSFERKYNDYKNNYIIIYTTVTLFVYLQFSIPSYTISKPHSKCRASLGGFPLDEDESKLDGLKYVSCILGELNSTDSIWKCLKKKNIERDLLQILKIRYNSNSLYQHKYRLKREYILKHVDEQEVGVNNVWNKFSPPLENFVINDDKLDKKDCTKKHDNTNEISNYFALKVMSEIDLIVNKSPVENTLFLPALLTQSCCLSSIENFNNLDFFTTKNAMIKTYLEKTKQCDLSQGSSSETKFAITTLEQNIIESFANIMFTLEDDLDQETITTLFEHYISYGDYLGEKHMYDNNICVVTAEERDAIKSKIYRNEEYFTLLENIFKKNLVENKEPNDKFEILENMINVIENNKVLAEDKYLQNFIEYLKKNPKSPGKGWDDFSTQLDIDKKELASNILDQDPKKKDINEILEVLGNLDNIASEDTKLLGEEKAKDNFFKNKIGLLYKFIYSNVNDTIVKIKNDSSAFRGIPSEWKLDKQSKELFLGKVDGNYELINKYMAQKNTNNLGAIYITIYEIIKNTTRDLKQLYTEEHVVNCNNKVLKQSMLTNENLANLLEYILIKMLTLMVNVDFKDIINIKHSKVIDAEETLEEDTGKSSGKLGEDLEGAPAPSSESDEFRMVNMAEKCSLVYDLLKEMMKETLEKDKFTREKIDEAIERKNDIEKEANLKFIEELDKESRQAVKQMIATGLYSYKNLHKLQKPDVLDKDEVELSEEELDAANREAAIAELGEGFSEDHFQSWLEEKHRNKMEEEMNLHEVELPMDDDGDEPGDEDFDGEY